MKDKQLFVNLSAQFFSFAVSFIISFFISPIIVATVGKETYGFLGIANNFTSYVLIITVALNSLAGRFVSIHYHQKHIEKTNQYFTSVFFSNLFIVAILIVPAIIFVFGADRFLDIPAQSVASVKWTFALVFLGFFVNLVTSIFSVATFVTNKIYLASIRTIEANFLRLAVLVLLFCLIKPNIAFVSLAMLVYYVFIAITNIRYTRMLIPEIRIKRKWFDFKKVKELVMSGIWGSITALSNVLLEGLDLLISNLLINASAMGTVSIVKTVPSMINQCLGSVLSVFTPQLTINYAKGDIKGMVKYLNYSCKVVAMIMSLPVAFLIAFGRPFFKLWMPTEDANLLWKLSVLSLGGLIFAGAVVIMHNIFTVTNHLKIPAIATLITGILNTGIVFTLLKTSNLGIFAVVSVSSCLALLRNVFVNIPYSARCIGEKPFKFYLIAGRSAFFVVIAVAIGMLISMIYMPNSWITLIIAAVLMCVLAWLVEFVFFFSMEEKGALLAMIKTKILRKKS